MESFDGEHRAIVAAVLAGNAEQATREIARHVDRTTAAIARSIGRAARRIIPGRRHRCVGAQGKRNLLLDQEITARASSGHSPAPTRGLPQFMN